MAETHSTTAGTAHEGGKTPFPPFQPDTFASQLVWLALSFGVLYLFLSRVGLPRLGRLIEERHKRVADDINRAAALKKKADEAGAAYEAALAEARRNAQAIAQQTRDRLADETAAKRKALEDDLKTKLAGAEQQIAATKNAAMANVESIATEAAAAIVQRLIGRAPAPSMLVTAVKTALKP